MKVNQLQTQNKNTVNLEELHALSSAYGNGLQAKDISTFVLYPAILTGVFALLINYHWFTCLPAVILGGIYGYKVIMPKIVQREYDNKSIQARNKFLTNMTQIISDPNRTVNDSIKYVISRTKGELQTELKVLLTSMAVGSDPKRVNELINEFGKKYEEDTIFNQYLEQLETAIHEGNKNIDSMQDLTEQHTQMLQKRNDYLKVKQTHLLGVKLLITVIIGIILMCHVLSFMMEGSFEMYLKGFAHHPIGYVTGVIFLPYLFSIMHKFVIDYFDDSVMELRVKTKNESKRQQKSKK